MRMSKHTAAATLTPAPTDLAKIRPVDFTVAVDVVKETIVDAVAEQPVADPPPAPHVDVEATARRDLKAEATSVAHILRHMPFKQVLRDLCSGKDVAQARQTCCAQV